MTQAFAPSRSMNGRQKIILYAFFIHHKILPIFRLPIFLYKEEDLSQKTHSNEKPHTPIFAGFSHKKAETAQLVSALTLAQEHSE